MSRSAVSQIIQSKVFDNKMDDLSYKFEQKNEFFSIQVARSAQDKLAAYGLVYEIYQEKGFIEKSDDALWYSIFDASSSTTTLVVKKNAEVVGCLTMIFDSCIGLPADELFVDEVDLQRLNSQKIVEIVSLGIKKNVRGANRIFKKLFDVNLYFSYYFHGAEDCLITVNPSHVNFYEKKMGYKVLSDVRSFKKVNGAPAVLMLINGRDIIEKKGSDFFKDFDCDQISKVFNFSLNENVFSEELFLKYFGKRPEFFRHNKNLKIKYFEKLYPDLIFNGNEWNHRNYEHSF